MHGGPHNDPGAGAVWFEPDPLEGAALVRRLPSEPHFFPEKRIYTKVAHAQRAYPCVSIDRADGHTPTISRGVAYLRVTLRPAKRGGSAGWRPRSLCAACAIRYRLARLER
jgi:hypothetical protein